MFLKRAFIYLAILALGISILAGCRAARTTGAKKVHIGIVQIVEHPSLNTIRESFIAGLAELGYKEGENIIIDYQNAQGDQSNLKSICQRFVSKKYDLIVAIATPSAQAAVGQTKEIPIVFAACTEPVGSGLVADLQKPGGNVTGTSDAISAAKIMELAERITPGFKTVGALYNASETNSLAVIKELKEYAQKRGWEVVEATVTNSSEVQQAAASLVGKADIIFSPTDNTVASAMPVVAQVAKKAKIPVYVGADSMVKDGGLATYGVNYEVLGKETAKIAAQILKGAKPGDIPVKVMSDLDIYVNLETARAIGVTIPEDILEQAKVFEK
ncbi:MAG TPA: ABC transporter substrate-binding protein [Moorella mulderi]|nr:ABC transporter substrate-binding protein [Moorella mulderi]